MKCHSRMKFEGARIRSHFRKLTTRVQKSAIDNVEQAAKLGAISCARQTQPFGTGIEAKQLGEEATERDIRRLYATPPEAFSAIAARNSGQAKAFWAKLAKGDIDNSVGILRASDCAMSDAFLALFDNGVVHDHFRNSRGRVPHSQATVMVVLDPENLKSYVQIEIARVGWAKAAWVNAARTLGRISGLRSTKQLPSGERDIDATWITRHTQAPFQVLKDYTDPDKPRVAIRSLVPYTGKVLTESQRREAERIATERLQKMFVYAAKYEAAQAAREAV